MKLYDENGRFVGELYEEDPRGGAILGGFGIIGVFAAFIAGLFAKWFGVMGYVVIEIIACSAMVFLWFRFIVPWIMEEAGSKLGGIVGTIFATVIAIPVLTVIFLFLGDFISELCFVDYYPWMDEIL